MSIVVKKMLNSLTCRVCKVKLDTVICKIHFGKYA